MSNHRRKERKLEIERVRDEGRQAFEAGRHTQTCPYSTHSPDWLQWHNGYDSARREAESRQRVDMEEEIEP